MLLEDLPLKEMAPQWMSGLVADLGLIRLDSRTRVVLDSFGTFSSFDSKVQLNELPLTVKVHGRVEGSELRVKFVSGDVSHEMSFPLPSTQELGGELIPEPKLPEMYVGRRWQIEMFSLFRPPTDAISLLQAEVVSEEPLRHDGKMVLARRIEYRDLSATGVATEHTLRAVVWAGRDGTVLRQDVLLANARLRFERRDDPEAIRLAGELLDLDTVATLTTPDLYARFRKLHGQTSPPQREAVGGGGHATALAKWHRLRERVKRSRRVRNIVPRSTAYQRDDRIQPGPPLLRRQSGG